jgi:hypothetical protein
MKKFFIVVLIIIIFWGVFFYKDFKLRCDYYYSSFYGKVSEIKYTEQKTISFKINKEADWIYLGTDIKYDIDIAVGDTLMKNNNDYNVILKKGKMVYNITSDRKFEKWSKYCKCK